MQQLDRLSIGLILTNSEEYAYFKIERMGDMIRICHIAEDDFKEMAELWAYRGMKHAGLIDFDSISDLYLGQISQLESIGW